MTQLKKSFIITAITLISCCNTYTIEINNSNKSNLCDEALDQFLVAFNPLTQAIRICNLFAAMRYIITTTVHNPTDTLRTITIKSYKFLIASACLTKNLLIGLKTKEYNQQRDALYKCLHTTTKKIINLSAQITAELLLCLGFGIHSMFPLLFLCNFINEDTIIK